MVPFLPSMIPENSCCRMPFTGLERTNSALIEPRAGETPWLYVERLSETVYKRDVQRSILETYRLCLEVGCVGQVCIKHYDDVPLERIHELYMPEGLAEARSRYEQAAEIMGEEEREDEFCFGASLKLQPKVYSQVVSSLNTLGYRLHRENPRLHRKFPEAFHSKALQSLSRKPLAVAVLKFLPPQLRDRILVPLIREDLSMGTWAQIFKDHDDAPRNLSRSMSADRTIELGDFEQGAVMIGAMEFLRYGIDVEVAFQMNRLIDDYYQLSGKLVVHQKRFSEEDGEIAS